MTLLDMLINAPWAIQPDKLLEIQAVYGAYLRGERIDLGALVAQAAAATAAAGEGQQVESRHYVVDRGVAVVRLHGPIAKRANLFSALCGGASHEIFARDLDAATQDSGVRATLVWGDTPGGTVDGVLLSHAAMQRAKAAKPLGVWADGLLASAGVWIGAPADQIYSAGETTVVGSVGVVATHVDISRAEEMLGRKTTEVVAGKYKRATSPYQPLSEAGRAELQQQVDHIYGLFVDAVAAGRGVSTERVLEDMADGRIFMGRAAIEAGLVDAFATRDEAITDLLDRAATAKRASVVMPTKRGASAEAAPAATSITTPQDPAMPGILHPDRAADATESIVSALAAEHPAVFSAIAAQGAAKERERIKAVREQLMPGHEALIETLAFDGKTTGPEAAVQVLNAERKANTERAKDLASALPEALSPDASATGGTTEDEKGKGKDKGEGKAQQDPHALAAAIAKKQAEARASGQTLSATQALAMIKKEAANG